MIECQGIVSIYEFMITNSFDTWNYPLPNLMVLDSFRIRLGGVLGNV